ncbi:PREDICTED: insulin-like peptide receptor [Polistes canadensis]|uniref:insulin-like peptide receptor n=1 Tax=Polistes canadensis TaxID=91411 RepID=UPI000718B7A6|nr:PREDICTED: insulin-like peptide receptor [Polistes canadensis]XP_014598476.1 PREDICTED: insulin-like peptide receptor [Polistes canadensis]
MRRMKLLLVLLCVLAPLAICQQQKRTSKPVAFIKYPENTAMGTYEDDFVERINKFDELSEDLSNLAVYRKTRAIDDNRSVDGIDGSNKSYQQHSSYYPRSRTKSSEEVREKTRRFKNVTIGDGICQSIDIRNNVHNFAILKGCRVIEGFLQIVLIENHTGSDFENVSFPDLREITGYLLLYRVYGLKSLGTLFPNLETIRGDILLTDYAFMVYEMQNLQEIGLTKLTKIARGGVRIEKNSALCYTNTLNWDVIVTAGDNFIKDNNNESSCPGCSSQCPGGYCWTAQHCQITEKPKCHHQCLGECNGETDRDCYVCKHYRHEGKCVESCPSHLYAYISRRCITELACIQMNNLRKIWRLEDEQKWRPFNGSCITQCPEGYEDHVDENNVTTCQVCKARCRKIGHSAIIRHISDAQIFRGTTVVDGALEFQIRNGNPNIMQELTEAFGLIEEITEYLKVTHSFPITSLAFFKKLRVIKGKRLDINNASLVILDNPNLSSLFPPSQKIDIEDGRLFFHYNPRLCMYKIIEFSKMVRITDFSDLEVQPDSNGEKVACNVVNINITVKKKGPNYIDLIWDSYQPPRGQQLLSYILSYMETENENITYEGNSCSNNTWQMLDVDIPNGNSLLQEKVTKHISGLKPYTKYAVYVKTFSMRNESFLLSSSSPVGQSKIIFFRTSSDIPSMPTDVVSTALSDTEILVKWNPPEYPNGPIGYYIISASLKRDDAEFLSSRDYCKYGLINEPEVEDIQEVTKIPLQPIVAPTSCCFKDEFTRLSTSKKFQMLLCNENFGISTLTAGWKGSCVFNRYNSVNDFKYKSENTVNVINNELIYNVSAENNSFRLKYLQHFSLYTISVAACGVKHRDDEQMCSSVEYTNIRTKKRETADNVSNVKTKITNSSIVEVSWDTVRKPNALTVSYTIEYTNLDVKDAKKSTECIPYVGRYENHKTHQIKNLSPGNYGLRIRSTSLAGSGNFSEMVYFSIKFSDDKSVVVIPVVIFGFFSVFLVIGCVYLRYRRKKNTQARLIACVNPDYIETKYILDSWEVPRESVKILEELGNGNFGMVCRGLLGNEEVAIKTISAACSEREKNEFLNEASVMKNFSTFHVIKLLGVVSLGSPPYVIMELMENGDLKTYLRRIRDTDLIPDTSRIIRMAAEIADGMSFLESKKFVHRDLAARNCMISKDLVCKIGDFGMARDVYETDYYKIGKKGLLPIRWMAPENLSDGVFTSDSDVWSFGVVLYEILSLAEIPYQGFSNDEVLNYVLHKGVLSVPKNCPINIQKIMEKCFKWRPSDRPTFMEIVGELEPFLAQDFCEKSFYHSSEGIHMRNLGIKKAFHQAAPIRFHWGNETARWVREFEDNVTLLDQTRASTSRGRIFRSGFQQVGNVPPLEEVPLNR